MSKVFRIAIGGTGNIAEVHAAALRGVLGRPLLTICHTTWFRDQAYFDVPWRGRWQTEGGGQHREQRAVAAAGELPAVLVAGIYAAAFGGGVVRPADLGAGSPNYARMDGLAPGWEQ